MKNMLKYLLDPYVNYRDRQRVAIALNRGGAMMNARRIDFRKPDTWEFSGFSQNGEDGVLDVLRSQLLRSNRYCIEIGVEDGVECNTAWLLMAEKYTGMMVEGNARLAGRANKIIGWFNNATECHHLFVTKETASKVGTLALHEDPDVFSLDIDGNDYYVAQALLDSGLRPKIFVVEYNAAFGPRRSATIPYDATFDYTKAHVSRLYYGVSIAAWRKLFRSRGYRFVTVERNGVNAFFADPSCFKTSFLGNVRGLDFAENQYQLMKFRKTNEEQFSLIADRPFVSV